MPLNLDEAKSKGWKIFTSNLGPATPVSITQNDFTVTKPSASKLSIKVDSIYRLTFAGVLAKIGIAPTMPIGASAEVSWGTSRLRVALVLDNTGSMINDGKIAALKAATKSLLQQLRSAAVNDGDVYVSIVPFNKDVNVGSANYNADWIDWTDWERNDSNGSCSDNFSTTKSVCVSTHCTSAQYTDQVSCQSHHSTWYIAGAATWTVNSHNTWNGCVMDRGVADVSGLTSTGRDYDQTIDPPVLGTTRSLVPAEPNSFKPCPPQMQIMGLNYNWSSMNMLVDNLIPAPAAQTNQPIGLVWGWQSLVGGGPLTAPAKDHNYTYEEVIILISDGLNNVNRWYSGAGTMDPRVDVRMYDAQGIGTCKNVKDSRIKIYTVQVNTTNDPTSLLLKNCATSPSMFFELRNTNAMVATFNQIGTNLVNLHLAK